MSTKYQLWYHNPWKIIHNILANSDLADGVDYVAYRDFENGKQQYCDYMSGDWAWRQCVSEFCRECPCLLKLPQKDLIAIDINMHGAIFIPIILGGDGKTVSVATSQHEYHPIYLSIGNVCNHIRRAHKDTLVLIGFLPIPKGKASHFSQGAQSHKLVGAQKDTNNDIF